MSAPLAFSSISDKSRINSLCELLKNLNVNIINEKDIKLTKSIAKGGQGKIKYGIFKNLEVIIKIISKENIIHIIQEVTNLIKYKSFYIPKFLGFFEKEKYFGLVMEFIEGLNLSKIIYLEKQGKISLSLIQKLNYLIQLSSVIDYLNSNNLVHRDLKTDNILVDKLGQLKLLDFGISLQGKKIWINIESPYYSLTPNYMAPEIVYQNEENEEYQKQLEEIKIKLKINESSNEKWILITDKYDVWTFGIIMCQLFTRCRPWCRSEKENISEIEVKTRLIAKAPYPINTLYPIKECKFYENDIKNIIKNCLNYNPEERPSMKDIKRDLLKIYGKVCNEKSIMEYYNKIMKEKVKNFEKNNKEKIIKINKNNNINNSNEKLLFQKFRKNKKNFDIENDNDDELNSENNNEKIDLFKDKILQSIIQENIKLKQDIEIKKSIIHNEFNIKLTKID